MKEKLIKAIDTENLLELETILSKGIDLDHV